MEVKDIVHLIDYIFFFDLSGCIKYWSQLVSTQTDYLALNQPAFS